MTKVRGDGGNLRIVRVITGLSRGGAEESLKKLILAERSRAVDTIVVCLLEIAEVGRELADEGISIVEVRVNRRGQLARLAALARQVRSWRPDIIEGWMTHGNLAASLFRVASPSAKVVWNVRRALPTAEVEPRRGVLLRHLSSAWSGRVDAVVYNSERSADEHRVAGFASDRAHVIRNGFDVDEFVPSLERRRAERARLGIEDASVIGHVSRWHEQKGHDTLLDTFAVLHRSDPSTRFILAGDGLTEDNEVLRSMVDQRGIRHAIFLLGNVRPISHLYPAFDAFALTSTTEGFPNVLGEALACGVPCVATDVGDCASLLDGVGIVANVGDSAALARGLQVLLSEGIEERRYRASLGRRKIVEQFSTETTASAYATLYQAIVSPASSKS